MTRIRTLESGQVTWHSKLLRQVYYSGLPLPSGSRSLPPCRPSAAGLSTDGAGPGQPVQLPAQHGRMRTTHPLLLAVAMAAALTASVAAAEDRQPAADPAPYAPPWSWPLSPAPVTVRAFDPPAQTWLAGHRGVDLAAAGGEPLLSPAAGRVVYAGRVVNRPVLTIDHGGGLKSSFEPAAASVEAGTEVAKGTVLGAVGTGAHCTAKCLHWGVRLDGVYVNPLSYVMDRRPSVLLPVPPPGPALGQGRSAPD